MVTKNSADKDAVSITSLVPGIKTSRLRNGFEFDRAYMFTGSRMTSYLLIEEYCLWNIVPINCTLHSYETDNNQRLHFYSASLSLSVLFPWQPSHFLHCLHLSLCFSHIERRSDSVSPFLQFLFFRTFNNIITGFPLRVLIGSPHRKRNRDDENARSHGLEVSLTISPSRWYAFFSSIDSVLPAFPQPQEMTWTDR